VGLSGHLEQRREAGQVVQSRPGDGSTEQVETTRKSDPDTGVKTDAGELWARCTPGTAKSFVGASSDDSDSKGTQHQKFDFGLLEARDPRGVQDGNEPCPRRSLGG
jgi:hypothetical protein